MTREISSAGIPIESNTMTSVTNPPCGTPAVPMAAHVAVILFHTHKKKNIFIRTLR